MATKLPLPPALLLAAALLLLLASVSGDDQFTKDKQACASELSGLAPCLPYVSDAATTPTADCCAGAKQVIHSSMKCVCLLVKYRNEPSLGIKIDVNHALTLPALCHTPANISQCTSLLHLAPNSPDAKVFSDFAKKMESNSTASAPAAASPVNASSDSKGSNHGGPGVKHSRAVALVYGVVFFFFFLVSCPV